MKIVITKPAAGKTTVKLDDSRGGTGLRRTLKGVAVEDVGTVVEGLAKEYEERKAAIREARGRSRP